jgi:acyl-CoA synthetase (NDP forming)
VVQFYSKVTHLPETPELVVVATPANTVPQVVEEVGQAGASAVVVVSGGFAEVRRRDLEEELVSVAKKYGVRVLLRRRPLPPRRPSPTRRSSPRRFG